MKKWTVVLLYPDYLTDSYGQDIYVRTVSAKTWEEATTKVQHCAAAANRVPSKFEDFMMILVVKGDVKVAADATSAWAEMGTPT